MVNSLYSQFDVLLELRRKVEMTLGNFDLQDPTLI